MVKTSENNSVRILSLQAKDIYLSSRLPMNLEGFSYRYPDGAINTRKFSSTIPYSLDLIKLRSVHKQIYRNRKFTFTIGKHEYTTSVICVNFDYTVKEFNKLYKDTYVRIGYRARDMQFVDHACVIDNELVGIECGQPVECPLPKAMLGNDFKVVNDCYQYNANTKTLKSVDDLREELYTNGFFCEGRRYRRWKRSSGSARVGKCLFIEDKLYKAMHAYDLCGLSIKQGDNIDLAGVEAYMALTASGIDDILHISPKNILLINDYESVFDDDVVAVDRDESGEVVASYKTTRVKNSIWDGQSLISPDAMGKYAEHGFILLRNRFFKSACFQCDIQKYFSDHNITNINQLNGTTLANSVNDIQIITTPSSIKYLKYGTFNDWVANIDDIFGVVKHEKLPHFFNGRMAECHYQLLNTLQLSKEQVAEFLKPSIDYIRLIQSDPAVLRYAIKANMSDGVLSSPLLNKQDIIYNLMSISEKFTATKMYADFRNEIASSMINRIKRGRVLISGLFAVMCGNPLEMLQQAIGRFNGLSVIGKHNVVSTRFDNGTKLLGARSPHVTMGNILLVNNVRNDELDRYFMCTDGVVYVNSIGENILQRLNGCD